MSFTISKPIHTWFILLKRDLYVFRKQYLEYLIDTLVWPAQAAIVFGYVLPFMGMSVSFGAHILIATVASKCLFDAYFQASAAVADINNLRSIDFVLTLPLPVWMILVKNVAYFIIRALCLNVPLLIIGKLVLQDRFPLDSWSPGLSFIAILITSIFFSMFSLWLVAWIRDQVAFDHAWVRCFDVLILWGSYWFPWYKLHAFSPMVAYITLLNPFTLSIEALRHSFMGCAETLPFWPCIGGLVLETILLAAIGYKLLKRRLDFVD